MQNPQIDPVSAAVAVFTVFVSPAVAHVMGVYSVIFLAAAFGSGWALMRREKKSLLNAVGFIILMTGTATYTTVGIAQLVNKWTALSNGNVLLGPVALLIGGVGHDWPKVIPILFNYALDFFSKFRSSSATSIPSDDTPAAGER